ncbi:hypothetical protein NLI96_g7083 [Meripilus lineatus]|uniref:DUF6570 domain-containing protein n=1 Tax=Meripilus lineatus TaxID=2056292 RepID=A0AAD5V231_9APHY|nr:hypothetical protein NLI96_g7083 [Physisporinus lineatus]
MFVRVLPVLSPIGVEERSLLVRVHDLLATDKLVFMRVEEGFDSIHDNEVAFAIPLNVLSRNLRSDALRMYVITYVVLCFQLISPPDDPCEDSVFPPPPLTLERCVEITNEWRHKLRPAVLQECACAVCARSVTLSTTELVNTLDPMFDLLRNSSPSVARQERFSSADAVVGFQGPLLLSLQASRLPTYSLVNGQWIGEVPDVLLRLNLVEQMMISLFRHNACVARVRQGQRKMVSNAIMFAQPVAELRKVLPPLASDIKACLAIVFIGPGRPTVEDYYRTQFVVRKQYVVEALLWLKLNHKDYADTKVDLTQLEEYPDDEPAGVFSYSPGSAKERGENIAVHDNDEQDGVETGMCPFTVQGLTSDMLPSSDTSSTIAELILHLKGEKEVLAIGRSSHPESIYHNPKLFPEARP